MTFLGDSQTYIGVLSTFIVLCLFMAKNEETSNFIIFTILKIAQDSRKQLNDHISALRNEFNSLWGGEGLGTEIFTDFIGKINDEDKSKLLSEKIRDIKLMSQSFANQAYTLSDKYHPEELLKDKEEFPFISLHALLMSILVMLIDCVECIDLSIRCEYVNILLIFSSLQICVLYHKFFHTSAPDSKPAIDKTRVKTKRWRMAILILLCFTIWMALSLFICEPIVCYFLLWGITAIGVALIKRKHVASAHQQNNYNRRYVIKHFCYLTIATFLCVGLLHTYTWLLGFFIPSEYMTNLAGGSSFLERADLAKYMSITYFTLNAIALPLFFGYLFLYLREKSVICKIDELHDKYITKYRHSADEFEHLKAAATSEQGSK